MAGFFMRKNQRFKDLLPVRYRGDGIVGEGMLKDLSLSGGSITGNSSVSVGMALQLHLFVPGDPEPVLVDRAVVIWVKGMEFGVELTLQPEVAQRFTKLITEMVKKSPKPSSSRRS
jgi:hypothetical protein